MATTKNKKRVLTGDRPTGPLHLGHYFGSLINRIKLQNKGYQCFIIIADYQVLTDRLDTNEIEKNIVEIVKDYLAVGLDPEKTTFFIQSKIPELAELTTIFSMLVSFNRVARNPTVKEEVSSMGLKNNLSLGMFSYPVSQAADILLFNPDIVPVGEDQLPHIELAREIARKFNATYKRIFNVPRPILGDVPRLLGLDGSEKMSKSRGNAIFLSESPDQIREKIMAAKTDSEREVRYDPVAKPEISNLIDLFRLVRGCSRQTIVSLYQGKGYKEFKIDLAETIINFLRPIQERRGAITEDMVREILKQGNNKAKIEAEKMMANVFKAMKMDYGLEKP